MSAEADNFADPRDHATPLGRFVWGLMGAGAAAVIATSAWLRPDARGFGTHQQLGLPPCEFSRQTGVPCPGCGLTTSFASMAHAHFVQAFSSHLMGPALFLLCLWLALFSPYAIVRKRPLAIIIEHRSSPWILTATALLGLLTFFLRLFHVLPSR
ncbi:MAG: DUF2752 domain-containing protein [Deltaproteobacteria bacterium]|nr:DUF2752 domain-containing protein [Deltaproteobacteria bacterium]